MTSQNNAGQPRVEVLEEHWWEWPQFLNVNKKNLLRYN